MSEQTEISWTDATFNSWEGCQKVSPGCDHCYAEARNARYNKTAINWGPGAPRRRTSVSNWNKPKRWNREAAAFGAANGGRKRRVFCSSLADVFDNAVDPQWRADLFELIDATPMLDWLLLTKRIGNVQGMLATMGRDRLPPHVWLGATIVNQAEADRDIPKLLDAPAAVRFLSMEPLLGPVDLSLWLELGGVDTTLGLSNPGIDWVIVGGESGPRARPMHPDWVRPIRDQCAAAGVPFHFKQWGEWASVYDRDRDDADWRNVPKPGDWDRKRFLNLAGGQGFHGEKLNMMRRLGKRAAGRLLDGAQHDGFPA